MIDEEMVDEEIVLRSWLRHAAIDRSTQTVYMYERTTRMWLAYLGSQSVRWDRATIDDATEWVAILHQSYGDEYVRHAVSSVRQFYKHATLRRWYDNPNPFDEVHGPRRRTRLPVWLTEDEIQRMRNVAASRGRMVDLLGRALLEVLYATGARIGSILSARVSDYRSEDMTIRVMDKGGKERILYLSPSAQTALEDYLMLTRPIYTAGKDAPWLFVSHHGAKLTRQVAAEIISRIAARAGIEKRVTPHVLRHSIATHLLERGMDVRLVQEFLGHARLGTTQIYTHVTQPQLRAKLEQVRPD